jgi:hypothetical protein
MAITDIIIGAGVKVGGGITVSNNGVITTGMVLGLDAANPRSYPGTGTTWYDLSGQENNATMFGAVPNVYPYFDFSTVTGGSAGAASLGFTFASNMIPTTGSFTLSCWIKNPPAISQIGLFSNAGGADGYRFGIGTTGVYTLMSGAGAVGYSEPNTNFLSTLSSAVWYNVSMVYDRAGTFSSGTPQWQLYLNGTLQGTTNMGTPQTTAFTAVPPGIVRSACCSLYTGQLSTFYAYNRALSATEVQQNFQAIRGRYGI